MAVSKVIKFLLLPLLISGVFSLTWVGGYIKPSEVNTYYYPGNLTTYPIIKVFDDSIKIGDYEIKIYSFDSDNRVDVWIDSLFGKKIFRIKPDNSGKIYFSICGLDSGTYTVIVNGLSKNYTVRRCISFTEYLEGDKEHKIEIIPVKVVTQPGKIGIGVWNWWLYILSGVALLLAIVYFIL